MPVKLVLIHKNGSIKDTTVKTFKLAELYKKCKFRNDSDFVGRATWKNGDNFVTLFAKDSGRAGGENKYDLPPPIDTTLYFGTMVVISHGQNVPTDENVKDITAEGWKALYARLFKGFEDLGEVDSFSEEEYHDPETLTKQGYLKDGFVVEDGVVSKSDDSEEEEEYTGEDEADEDDSDKDDDDEEEDEEAAYGKESDVEVPMVEDDDDDDEGEWVSEEDTEEDEDGGSELEEEAYA